MSDDERDAKPLFERVDALLKKAQPVRGPADVPVLTEVVTDELVRRRIGVDRAALERIAHEIEAAMLARLQPELERLVSENLNRALSTALGKALDTVGGELRTAVRHMVREAIAASVANAVKSDPQ
ncbi:MAG TPA: hypothetical protein VGI18_05555 [Burkholderiales bacterium]|jgi:hypothetical protein